MKKTANALWLLAILSLTAFTAHAAQATDSFFQGNQSFESSNACSSNAFLSLNKLAIWQLNKQTN